MQTHTIHVITETLKDELTYHNTVILRYRIEYLSIISLSACFGRNQRLLSNKSAGLSELYNRTIIPHGSGTI